MLNSSHSMRTAFSGAPSARPVHRNPNSSSGVSRIRRRAAGRSLSVVAGQGASEFGLAPVDSLQVLQREV